MNKSTTDVKDIVIPNNATSVSITHTSINVIPEFFFGNLTQCTRMNLSYNANLSTIEENGFAGLNSVTVLVLSCSGLQNLTSGIFLYLNKCRDLMLDADGCYPSLENIGESTFKGLSNLLILRLSHQLLTALSKNMFLHLDSLQHLYLGWNRISVIGASSFLGMPQLRELQINNNFITLLSVLSFNGLANLAEVNLRENCIKKIPSDFFQSFPKMLTVSLSVANLGVLKREIFAGKLPPGLSVVLYHASCMNPVWSCLSEQCWLFAEGSGELISFDHMNINIDTCYLECDENITVTLTGIYPVRGSGAFGPLAGGTLVSLTGNNLNITGKPIVLLSKTTESNSTGIEQLECNVTHESERQIVFKTPPLSKGSDLLDKDLNITISWPPVGHPLKKGQLESEFTFTYLPDPVIHDFHPKDTIISGGIELTVVGQHMASVAQPVMEMKVYQRNQLLGIHYQHCRLGNNTEFYCSTASLHQYKEFNASRRKRNSRPASSCRSQLTQDEEEYQYKIANQEVYVTIGFILDDLAEYHNYDGCLNVFQDPEIETFGDPDEIGDLKFRPFWPFDDEYIHIDGEHLLVGVKDWFYIVSVGVKVCDVIDVANNQITCRPPASEPRKHIEDHAHPAIKVHIGMGITKTVGYLDYDRHIFEYLPVQIGTGMLLASIVTVCVRTGHRIGGYLPIEQEEL